MNERRPAWRHRMATPDRQMLAAARLPVITFGAVLIGERISRIYQHQLPVVCR